MNMQVSKQEFFNQMDSAQQFRQLFDFLPNVYFFVKNERSQFVMANKIFIEKCGEKSEEDIIGKTDFDYFPHDRAAMYIKDDKKVMQSGTAMANKVELSPEQDNSIAWFVTSKVPLYSKDGKIIGVAGSARTLKNPHKTLTPYGKLGTIVDYIRKNYSSKIEIPDLATMAHLSISQFERNFAEAMHMSPIKYLLRIRIEAACNSLRQTNDTISRIAQETGFYDHSHFTRQFTKVMSMTPSAYRKRQP
jgi:AraC-like DNA-binding protein